MKARSREVVEPMLVVPSTIRMIAGIFGKFISEDGRAIIWTACEDGPDELVPINHYIWRSQNGSVQWMPIETFDKLYEIIS